MSAALAGHLRRARELLAEPSPPGLFDLASRVGALEELLATICDDVEAAANPNHGSDLAPGSRIVPPCPECVAAAKRGVTWTGRPAIGRGQLALRGLQLRVDHAVIL